MKNFEDFLGRLTPTLKRITHKLNGHFSFFDDDDLFQEALVYLWISFQKGKLDDKTDSYILQGCYFHLKNFLRKTMDRARFISLNELIGEEDPRFLEELLTSKDSAPIDVIDTALLMEKAKTNGLTERETAVLSFTLDGLTVREIGKRLGISHVMVVKIKKRLKTKCRALKDMHNEGYQNQDVFTCRSTKHIVV